MPLNRCRLVLVLTSEQIVAAGDGFADNLTAALAAGDVASIIFAQTTMDETPYLDLVRPLVEVAQSAGIAAIIAGDGRIAGRSGADGVQLGQDPDALRDACAQYQPKLMVGAGNVRTRHNALVLGDLQPDYVMFGKPGADTRVEPHPKNLDLGGWWATMVEIPCIVLGGTLVESVIAVSQTGAEFVALGSAIFAPEEDGKAVPAGSEIGDRIRKANELLDEHAPSFDEEE